MLEILNLSKIWIPSKLGNYIIFSLVNLIVFKPDLH